MNEAEDDDLTFEQEVANYEDEQDDEVEELEFDEDDDIEDDTHQDMLEDRI